MLPVQPTPLHLFADNTRRTIEDWGPYESSALFFFLQISPNCKAKDMDIVSVSKRLMCMWNDVRSSHAVIV
jgi:hypothetical protein